MTTYSVGILTLSDKGARGEREDTSGAMLKALFAGMDEYLVVRYLLIPDDQGLIAETLSEWVDVEGIDLIVTTGGTGVSPSDRTPEATRMVIEREVPGIAEAMRMASLQKTIQAVWSRGMAGIRKGSLIVNLPGSEKAARENIEAVLPALAHGLYKLKGGKADCGVLV
ncbi:MAG TPA: MogA/MoaB family molybdenum cofactor biosynthesis protein [Desulfobulbus sp.]|nr:MogA/MoaB family molybdenum cofactor biosynthesis protein [Desulfobulbus sp.]